MVALCSASARTLVTLAWMRASRAVCLRRFAEPGALREWAREARRIFRSAALSGLGPGISITFPSLSTPVSSVFTPRSIPAALPQRRWQSGSTRWTSTVNDTNHRCAVRETVADRIRAVPFSSLRASFRVDSWVRMVPSRGSVTVVPEQRITPAPNRNESLHFPRFLAFGNPSRLPFRRPFFDLMKSRSARSRSRNASW